MFISTLPIHASLRDPSTGCPLRAIAVRKDGRPVWPVLGAEDPPEPDDKGGDKPLTMTQTELDALIGRRLASERAKFGDYDQLKASKAELDKIKADNASELDKAVAKAKAEGVTEATTRANQRLVAAEARALAAAANFHNPADAARLLDLSKIAVDDDGEPDTAAIKALIDQAITERPYLVKDEKGGKLRRDPGQGPRPGEKPDGREAGRAEAERRFGKKS